MSNNGGFLLGGTPARALGLMMQRSSQRPVLPPTTDRTMPIPGQAGAWDFGADLQPRPFDLVCSLVRRDATGLQQAVSTLARFLLDTAGRPRSLPLVLDTASDRTYSVRYSGTMPIDRVVGLGQFTLPLVAFDPFGYGPEQITEVKIENSPHSFIVLAGGDVVQYPRIEIRNVGDEDIEGFTITNTYRID